ncbi:MAG: glutamine-hydrolyzing GMP synthase [Patescibacteria group bacterium]
MDTILILDFGSQVTQLIARRLRAMQYHAEILPYNTPIEVFHTSNVKGIIFSGGPSSVYAKNGALPDPRIFELGKPILGICYGIQVLAHMLGGKVKSGTRREYGRTQISNFQFSIFNKTPKSQTVWMSHFDVVTKLPKGFKTIASSSTSPHAAIGDTKRHFYGVQFHLEVAHTEYGPKILENFAKICKMRKQWTTHVALDHTLALIRENVRMNNVVHALSGGVDSTVLALLLKKANVKVKNIFIDNGLLRLDEAKEVRLKFKSLKLQVKFIDASKQFLAALKGVTDPEQKRKIIGRVFIEVFMKHIGPKDFLSQGTLYPDVIESVKVHGPSDTIKTHHNRAPEVLELIKQGRVVEPLKELFKDEVRALGKELGLPEDAIWRHPFPGPGLGIRILGEITPERLEILRKADAIFIEEIKKEGHYRNISQALAALDTSRAVGVKGDEREYGYMILLRAITTPDFMTADWYQFPHEFLSHVSNRIVNEVTGVTRVLYDITQKPPATIEFL